MPQGLTSTGAPYPVAMPKANEIEVVFEPQPEGGFTVYSPELPGMVTQGDTLEEAEEMGR